MVRFEFRFLDEQGVPNAFGVHGISDNVAKGIRQGLKNVAGTTEVKVEKIVEDRTDVTTAP